MRRAMYLLFCLLFFAPFLVVSHAFAQTPLAGKLQRTLDESRRRAQVTGASAAAILPDGTLWTGVSGMSQPDSGKAISPDMLFNLGSIGKNYTAALVLKLAEEGRLSLQDTVGNWLPEYPHIDGGITVTQLLNHTSGLFDFVKHAASPWQRPFDDDRIWSSQEILSELMEAPYFPAGDGWHYSSTNYLLLRLIAEKAAGENVSDLLSRYFFRPLELGRTVAMEPGRPLPENVHVPHYWLRLDSTLIDISETSQHWESTNPHMVWATAADVVRWTDALFGRRQVLSPPMLQKMLAFHSPAPDEVPLSGYGLGVCYFKPPETGMLFGMDDTEMYGHFGSGIGYRTITLYLPAHETSIALFINDHSDSGIVSMLKSLLQVLDNNPPQKS